MIRDPRPGHQSSTRVSEERGRDGRVIKRERDHWDGRRDVEVRVGRIDIEARVESVEHRTEVNVSPDILRARTTIEGDTR